MAKKLILTLRTIMISQEVDLVSGDFNGTAWRYRLIVRCPRRRAPHHCGDPDPFGFLKPPGSHRFWKVHKHGAVSIPRKTLGLRPNDQSCHHETWLHLDFVDWSNTWSKQDVYEQRIP